MQATEDRERDDLVPVWLLLRLLWGAGDALVPALVRSGLVEIGLILLHGPIEMALIEDEEVVQAFPPHTAQESLANGIGFGLSWPKTLIRPRISPTNQDDPIRRASKESISDGFRLFQNRSPCADTAKGLSVAV
jgi:hypothetical protein